MDIKELEAIASLMKENELTKLELEEKGIKLKLERMPQAAIPAPAVATSVTEKPLPTETKAEENFISGSTIKSPTVGVFYAAPSPESSPYVKVGDKINKGDVVCIIEAMKLMNEIVSEYSGEIVEICVGNGQVVEYGQPLFIVK